MKPPTKVDILGTAITIINASEALELIDDRRSDRALTFAFCNVHSVMSARADNQLAEALAATDITAPDGMPLVWGLRWIHGLNQERMRGPTFMRRALIHGVDRRWTHFFYGTNPETLAKLVAEVEIFAPGIAIVGTHAPPYRPLGAEEVATDFAAIRRSGADIVWIGLGMPKQELLMHSISGALPGQAILAVGAAFDFLAGNIPEAPQWMQRAGLEWLFRLWREPRRLWRRYLFNNPAFLVSLTAQLLRSRLTRH